MARREQEERREKMDPTKTRAEEFKTLGNDAFAAKRYEEAIELYTQAINTVNDDHVYYSNRSVAYFNLENYEAALKDANFAVSLNPSWARGYLRQGKALAELGRHSDAHTSFSKGVELDPTNKPIRQELEAIKKKVLDVQKRATEELAKAAEALKPKSAAATNGETGVLPGAEDVVLVEKKKTKKTKKGKRGTKKGTAKSNKDNLQVVKPFSFRALGIWAAGVAVFGTFFGYLRR